jgi:hypothetical protein
MFETVNIGRWTLEVDRDATQAAFAEIPLGSPETCPCDYCKNLIAARHSAYPAEALEMFAKLGIDSRKEAETWQWNRLDSGLHFYGGFFHLIGRIVSGAEAVQWKDGTGTFHLESAGEYFEYGFTNDVALLEEPFKGQPIVQMEFTTYVPWVIDAPDPEELPPEPRTFLTKLREFFAKG